MTLVFTASSLNIATPPGFKNIARNCSGLPFVTFVDIINLILYSVRINRSTDFFSKNQNCRIEENYAERCEKKNCFFIFDLL